MERRMKFLFLEVIHRLYSPSIIHSLTRNWTASCSDLEKILEFCKGALPPYFLKQIEHVLCNHISSYLNGRTTAVHAYINHPSFSKNLTKVEKTLRKEECTNHLEVLSCWLERFFPDICLTTQVLIFKEGKNDHLVFDGSFLEATFSTYINKFV